jgi:hypothetical protein
MSRSKRALPMPNSKGKMGFENDTMPTMSHTDLYSLVFSGYMWSNETIQCLVHRDSIDNLRDSPCSDRVCHIDLVGHMFLTRYEQGEAAE